MYDNRRWITAAETAAYLGLHLVTVYRLISQRKIPHSRVGGIGVRVDREALDKIITAGNRPLKDALSILQGSAEVHPVKKS
jgi:excisionase family DNA binding protein